MYVWKESLCNIDVWLIYKSKKEKPFFSATYLFVLSFLLFENDIIKNIQARYYTNVCWMEMIYSLSPNSLFVCLLSKVASFTQGLNS